MTVWTQPIAWSTGAVTAATFNTEIRDKLIFLKGSLDILTGNTTADTGDGTFLDIDRDLVTSAVLQGRVTGDTSARFRVQADGQISWTGGSGSADFTLTRESATSLALTGANFISYRPSNNLTFIQGRITGDTLYRVGLTTNASGQGMLGFSAGSGAVDTVMIRNTAGEILLPAIPDTRLKIEASGSAVVTYITNVDGDTVSRWSMTASGAMTWGSGSLTRDTTLSRASAGWLTTAGYFEAAGGIRTMTVAGPVSDASFTVAPVSGSIAIDTTSSKIFVRVGSTWKSVVLA